MSPALARILEDLARHRTLFDLERGGLGRDLCKAATDGVQECLAGEHAPDGTRWDELSPDYAEWKAFHYPGNPIGLLHGTMDDPREVAGEVDVTPERATVAYGITDEAREEAAWFQEGNDRQPPRPFWGLTGESLAESDRLLDERFDTL